MKRRPMRNVVRAVLDTTWLILPAKLEQVAQFLEARASGVRLSKQEVRSAFGFDVDEEETPQTVNGVRLLGLFGILSPRMNWMTAFSGGTSTQLLAKQIDDAIADDGVKSIVLECDSPGGAAQGCEECAQKIYAARGKKPIIAVVRGIAASAAYWIASQCDQVIVTASSEVGSIGALTIHSESSKADAERGVKYTIIQAGEFKSAGNPYVPLDAKTKGVLQERVDAYYKQFVAAVARGRGVTSAHVEAEFGQGKMFLPEEAMKRGMADRVASLETVLAELAHRPSPSSPSPPRKETRPVNKRIKSALYALELVESTDAADDVCQAALGVFVKTIKAEMPKSDDAILSLLAKQFGGSAVASDDKPTPAAAAAEEKEAIEVAAAAAERKRIADLKSRRELLAQSGLVITDEVFQASVDNSHKVPEALDAWTKQAKKENAATKPEASGSAADTFIAAATDALMDRLGIRKSDKPLSQEARDIKRKKLIDIASFELRQRNVRTEGEPEEIAAQWLAQGGRFAVESSHGSLQRAADFPHLLSNIAGKMLDQAIEIAEATYPQWTARIGDAADLKPHPILAIGNFDELDRIGDDEEAKQLKLDEEMPAWFQVDRFANKAGLTAVMVANDDLDLFTQAMQSLSLAHENTLNRLCVALITGNVTMLDGNALYDDTNHKNDIASGGAAPQSSQYSAHRVKHRSQTGVGGKGFIRTPPKIVLVPAALETDAQTTTLPFANFSELKVPVTDATLNPFRGKLVPVVEPELDANSTLKWYTFCDPAVRRVICHVFQTGYGRGGRRTSWFDPDAETRWFRLEGRFAAFAASHRGTVRNKGAA